MLGKDIFVLKKNAWYTKLVKKVWNLDHSDFSHMCPFFWLAFGTVLFFPVIFVAAIIVYIFRKIAAFFEAIEDKKRRKKSKKRYEWDEKIREEFERILNDENLLKAFVEKFELQKYKKTCISKFEKAIRQEFSWSNSAWSKYFQMTQQVEKQYEPIFVQQRIEEEKKQEQLYDARRQRKDRINNLLSWIKPITKGMLYVLTFLGAIGIIVLIYFAIITLSNLSGITIIRFFVALVFVGICLLTIYSLIKLFGSLIEKIFYIEPSCKTQKKMKRVFNVISFPFISIYKGIRWLLQGIKRFILLFVQMLKNECPAIKWED